jgi:hypothetical protein
MRENPHKPGSKIWSKFRFLTNKISGRLARFAGTNLYGGSRTRTAGSAMLTDNHRTFRDYQRRYM